MEVSELTGDLAEASKHLEFLGYEITVTDESRVTATHAKRADIQIVDIPIGMIIIGFWEESERTKTDRLGYLEFINAMNNENVMLTYGTNDSGLWAQGTYYGAYDKQTFGQYMEAWNEEIEDNERLRESEYMG